MRINANYRLTAASNESKELIEMAKAAYRESRDISIASEMFGFAFNQFYVKKYSKQKLVSICLGALCDILDLNANLARIFHGDIAKLTELEYNDFVVRVTDGNPRYNIENIMLMAFDGYREIDEALYKSFVEYAKANSYDGEDADYSPRAYRNPEPDRPFEI